MRGAWTRLDQWSRGRDALRGIHGASLLAIGLAGLTAPACDVDHAEDAASIPAPQQVVVPRVETLGAAEPTISSIIPALGISRKGCSTAASISNWITSRTRSEIPRAGSSKAPATRACST
jgi:hypothetical protein